LAAACLRVFGSAVNDGPEMAVRRPGERRPVMWIDRDRLFEQSQGHENSLFRYRKIARKPTQVEIVGSEVGGRPRGGALHLGGLQSRLDDPGDADSDLVLQLEYIFQRAVEAVGPQMSAGQRIDQLGGDP